MLTRIKTFLLGLLATGGIFLLYHELNTYFPLFVRNVFMAPWNPMEIQFWGLGLTSFLLLLWLSSRFYFSQDEPSNHRIAAMALLTGLACSFVNIQLSSFSLMILLAYLALVGLFQYVMMQDDIAFHWILGLIAVWPIIILSLNTVYLKRIAEQQFVTWYMIGVFSLLFSISTFFQGKAERIAIPSITFFYWLSILLLSHHPLVRFLVSGESPSVSWNEKFFTFLYFTSLMIASILPGYLLLALEKKVGKKRRTSFDLEF